MITTCTLFNPMPSMSSMIMNEFGMRSDCQNYSCAGMGCAGGVAMLALAQDLLTVRPQSTQSPAPQHKLSSLSSPCRAARCPAQRGLSCKLLCRIET